MEYVNGTKVGQLDSPAVTLSPSWQPLQVTYTALGTGSVLYFTVRDAPVAVSEAFNVDNLSACTGSGVASAAAAEAEGTASLEGVSIAPSVKPNPVGREATLTFATSRAGALQVEVYDVGGRRVRMLVNNSNAPAGTHVVRLDDRGDDGARLGSGVFFYRIRSADGSSKGHFLVMK